MGSVDGQVALITGAGRGQGAETARLFAAEGALVIVTDIGPSAYEVARSIGRQAYGAMLDVTKEDDWQRVLGDAKERFGSVDILINNAGIVHLETLLALKQADFQRILDVDLIGAWLGIKATAPGMIAKRNGAIVNICSTAALWGMNGLGAYVASKWALRGLTKTAALELGFKGVRVNAIFPGGIDTPQANIVATSPEEHASHYQGQPIRRMGRPEEIARVSLFLVSEAASYLCGAELAVDGGMTVGNYTRYTPGAPGPDD